MMIGAIRGFASKYCMFNNAAFDDLTNHHRLRLFDITTIRIAATNNRPKVTAHRSRGLASAGDPRGCSACRAGSRPPARSPGCRGCARSRAWRRARGMTAGNRRPWSRPRTRSGRPRSCRGRRCGPSADPRRPGAWRAQREGWAWASRSAAGPRARLAGRVSILAFRARRQPPVLSPAGGRAGRQGRGVPAPIAAARLRGHVPFGHLWRHGGAPAAARKPRNAAPPTIPAPHPRFAMMIPAP